MAKVNEKIDEILKTVTSLDRRMKQFEDTFKGFEELRTTQPKLVKFKLSI